MPLIFAFQSSRKYTLNNRALLCYSRVCPPTPHRPDIYPRWHPLSAFSDRSTKPRSILHSPPPSSRRRACDPNPARVRFHLISAAPPKLSTIGCESASSALAASEDSLRPASSAAAIRSLWVCLLRVVNDEICAVDFELFSSQKDCSVFF